MDKFISKSITIVIIGLIILGFLFFFSSQLMYIFAKVEEQETGIQFRGGQISNIVGPGIYSDFGLFVEMKRISRQGVSFSVTDPEIITKDKQLLGLTVTGQVFRPSLGQADIIRRLWGEYMMIYTNDQALDEMVSGFAQQAMKVCVGQRTFNDSIIGSARDDLRNCVDEELGKFSSVFGATLANVVVPDVVLSDDVRSRLDAIVQSRLETEKAAQDKLKADAESAAEQARQEGEIRVQQSRIQEESKQQTLLAELEQKKILSQKSVIEAERANELARVEAEQAIIEAQKINELLAAEKDLEINQAMAKAAVEKAKADLAYQQILAGIYDKNPGLLNLRIVQANADALKATDKLIFTPEGTVPNIVIPGSGVLPTINTAPVSP